MRLACWVQRLAETIFSRRSITLLFFTGQMGAREVRAGATPAPTRETRALPKHPAARHERFELASVSPSSFLAQALWSSASGGSEGSAHNGECQNSGRKAERRSRRRIPDSACDRRASGPARFVQT